MIGRTTHIVDCRETMGLGEGGGLAQRGTFAQCGGDVVAVAMSPGRRHITKPICEITFALRENDIKVSTLVLNAGAGVPSDAPEAGAGGLFGITPEEAEQIGRHKLALVHLGAVRYHIIYKARLILRNVDVPCIIVCEYPVDFEDFAKIGVKTRAVMPDKPQTKGIVVDIVSGVVRGETCPQEKLDEIVNKVKKWLNVLTRLEY
ncbi:methyl-coenzyme M reductase I operon protein C [Methanothermus fervidus DSM 2088]|uniref:Methyl-coenzyme M reductase operon protein C n=1 Tax=Methanothermus fervidus (strain ATCC 43054 / DSM 2088 / JCM 10308 / V24 S) TaxID=523846 RepID=E3GZ53_METFV|nr:methyl-coenzyme M reductase I operon protein C [Methanothermus fervidus]ADP77585.1 methyl-coenzyme M reductase I operon protein C [Methanothermus fervidus DSM 2088]